MAGGSNRHALLCANIRATLVSRLRGRECRAVGSAQRVKIEATGLLTYPDAAVCCSPSRFEGKSSETLITPKLIVEVLSPSTAPYDRTTKFTHYRQLASLTDYLLIAQEQVLVEHFRRQDGDAWLLRTYYQRQQGVALPDLDFVLPVSELYEGVEVPTGLLPLRELDNGDEA